MASDSCLTWFSLLTEKSNKINFKNNKDGLPKAQKQKKHSGMKRRKRWVTICQLIIGVVFVLSGTFIYFRFESLYDMILNAALTINPTSQAFKVWRKNDPPLTMDIYLFNWTNPDEIDVPGVKPRLQEVGPYRFKEIKEKMNITFDDVKKTVSYMHRKLYYFDAENSVRNLSDVITTLNAVPLAIAYKFRDASYLVKKGISFAFSSISTKVHVTKTAGEILFDGYKDDILSLLSWLPVDDVKDKFGIFYGKNGTIGNDGKYVMSVANDKTFGKLLTWNDKKETNFYSGQCNSMKGSAGEFYPLNRKRDRIQFYSSELCRLATLEYERDVVIKGVHAYRYTARNIFDNGTLRKENACFCTGECQPTGVLNVSTCRLNSPSFLSFPHFYNADPYYTNAVDGLNPKNPKHEFYITMQPKTGIIMDISAKMQLNFLLRPDDTISMYQNVPKIYFPIFYFDQDVRMRDELAENLRMIQNLPEYSNYLVMILMFLGILNVVWCVCSVFYCRQAKFPPNTQSGEEVPLQNNVIKQGLVLVN